MVTLGLGEVKATHTCLHSWEEADLGWEPWGAGGRGGCRVTEATQEETLSTRALGPVLIQSPWSWSLQAENGLRSLMG